MTEGKGINLSSVPRLQNAGNVASWRNAMETQFLIAGVKGIVDGSDNEPNRKLEVARVTRAGSVMPSGLDAETHTPTTEQEESWKKWQLREDLAQGMIRGTVSDGILVDLLGCHSAKEMWDFALETNSLEDPETQFEIWNEFARMRLDEDPTSKQMENHMEKYNSLLLKASYAGLNLRETERIDRFLITLPKSFEVFRLQFRASNRAERTWMTVRKEYNREANSRENRARMDEEDEKQASVLAMKAQRIRRNPTTSTCYNCDEVGHFARDCPKPRRSSGNGKKSETPKDGKTMALGQWTMTLSAVQPKRRMWDEEYGVTCRDVEDGCEETESEVQVDSQLLSTLAIGGDERWILDSGATHHVTPNRTHLVNVTTLKVPMSFTTAAGSRLACSQKGDMPIVLPSGREVLLQDVHLVPESAVNLLSARQMAARGWSVTMCKGSATVSKGVEVIELTDREGLWIANFPSRAPTPASAMTSTAAPAVRKVAPIKRRIALRDEHERLGHLGPEKLRKLAYRDKLRISHASAVSDKFRLTDCGTCQKIQVARRAKNGISPHGRRNGELVHLDIGGPFDPSARGCDHFVALLDDYSKTCAIVPMKGRKPTLNILKEFVARIETQLGETVRFIRSDNGPELVGGAAKEWYNSKGFIHQVSPRYIPELNGTSERFIRTVKEMVGSMLDDSVFHHSMWDYAAQYAAVIYMKTTEGNNGISTWEQYTYRAANVDSIAKFGASCFIHIPRQARLKARLDEPKAIPGRVIGQAEDVSGWIVMTDKDGAIHRSRDVRLVDDESPWRGAVGEESASRPTVVQREADRPMSGKAGGGAGVSEGEASRQQLAVSSGESDNDEGDATDAPINIAHTPEVVPSPLPESPIPQRDDTPTPIDVPPKRIRPTTTIELVPEKTIEIPIDLLPPTSHIDETGRRIMPRRAVGRVNWTAATLTDDESDDDLEEEVDVEVQQGELALTIGWLLSTVVDDDEPASLREALRGPNGSLWQKAVDVENQNLLSKGTYSEVRKPVGRKTIGCRYVLKVKRDALGKIIKFKARLVAQGFSQVPGVDFEETYAPVGRTASLRILLAIGAHLDLEIQQADVEGAYLNGKLDVDIYMRYPEGMKPSPGCDALKLNKALYGLKQAGRVWWMELGSKLEGLGFSKLHSDWGLYVRKGDGHRRFMMVLVYVDDFVIAAKKSDDITEFLADVAGYWKLSDMGEISTILGMKVVRDRSTRKIYLHQPAYVDKIVQQFPTAPNPKFKSSTPLPGGYADVEDSEEIDPTQYQGLVGCLQWLATCTRPDISYTASFLARHLTRPTKHHFQLAIRTVSYLQYTRNYGLSFEGGDELKLCGFVDADWAGCLDTRRSTTGYVFRINDTSVIWSSKRQPTVASSTVEAEYVGVSEAGREAMWLRCLLTELGFSQTGPTVIHCDNKGAIRLALNPGTHQRTNNIDIKHHFIRELIDRNVVLLEYVQSREQLADVFTKGLPKPRHTENTRQLGLVDMEKRLE